MIPMPVMCRLVSSGTMTSIPPMMANARIFTAPCRMKASRRSIVPPPQNARQVNVRGTAHRPWRLNSLITAMPRLEVGSRAMSESGSGSNDREAAVGRSRTSGSSSP